MYLGTRLLEGNANGMIIKVTGWTDQSTPLKVFITVQNEL
jgi:hypothetical protein